MGTYLSLELKDKKEASICAVNKMWREENPGYEKTLRFNTRADIRKVIKEIQSDPSQSHLHYIKTPKDFDESFCFWGIGDFQVKLTLGDYLCSEMAKRYLRFINRHRNLFVEIPSQYELNTLRDAAKKEHRAQECLAGCRFCG